MCLVMSCLGFTANCLAATQSLSLVGISDNSIAGFLIRLDPSSGPVAVAWTALPPYTDTIRNVFKNPWGIDRTDKDLEHNKFTITSTDGKSFDVNGGSYIPPPLIDRNHGISTIAQASWAVSDGTIPPTGTSTVQIKMSTQAEVIPFDPRAPNWFAGAYAEINDPFHFPPIPQGGNIGLDMVLYEGQIMMATGDAEARNQFRVGTSLPGYEELYRLDLLVQGNNGGEPTLSVDFFSHSALGMNNQATADIVSNAFAFDPELQQFVLTTDLPVFAGSLPLPEDAAFDLYIDLETSAEATALTVVDPVPTGTVIVSPIAVLANGFVTEFGTSLENLINQTGFTAPFVSGETSFDGFVNAEPLANGRFENVWSSTLLKSGEPDGDLILDFGEPRSLDRLAIWNATLAEVGVSVSNSADGPWEDIGSFTLQSKLGTESAYTADVLDLQGVYDAQFVRLHVDSLYRPSDDSAWFAVVNEVAASVSLGAGLLGDFNLNGELDVEDIDLLTAHMRESGSDSKFDVTSDGVVNEEDLSFWVHDLTNTYFGDANLDRVFDSSDLIEVFQHGLYEIDEPARWDQGDWDGDGSFTSGDLISSFVDGGYSVAAAVPEPCGLWLLVLGVAIIAQRFREV